MPYQLVTCPETAHLELIEYEATPIGMLILACSQFRPPGCLSCPRTCAARIDGRARERGDRGRASEREIAADDGAEAGTAAPAAAAPCEGTP
jgi:hypothetical protein